MVARSMNFIMAEILAKYKLFNSPYVIMIRSLRIGKKQSISA